jgi:hypothetical protein
MHLLIADASGSGRLVCEVADLRAELAVIIGRARVREGT